MNQKLHVFGEFWRFFMVFGGFLVNFECFTWFLMSQNKQLCVEKNIHISTIKISTFKMCILCTYWIICIWHIWQIGLVLRRSQILAPIWNIVLGNISTRIYYPHFFYPHWSNIAQGCNQCDVQCDWSAWDMRDGIF